MDMRINSSLVRSERERRAWSQEQLASVTGLGLRTITRIETTGRASHESVKALASVFHIEVAALRSAQDDALAAPMHIRWIRRVGVALITPIRLIDRRDSVKANVLRITITFSFLFASISCYLLGIKVGSALFMIAAMAFEIGFYYRLVYRSKPYA